MELINTLKDTKESTLKFFDLPDADLDKSYQEGKWTIRQLLNHLADAETVLYDRIRRVIAKPKQVVWSFDQKAWAKNLNYNKFPLSINKQIYSSVRDSIIYLVNEFYESKGENEFIHSETGLRLLKDEFEKVALHNQHHLNQIIKALNK